MILTDSKVQVNVEFRKHKKVSTRFQPKLSYCGEEELLGSVRIGDLGSILPSCSL